MLWQFDLLGLANVMQRSVFRCARQQSLHEVACMVKRYDNPQVRNEQAAISASSHVGHLLWSAWSLYGVPIPKNLLCHCFAVPQCIADGTILGVASMEAEWRRLAKLHIFVIQVSGWYPGCSGREELVNHPNRTQFYRRLAGLLDFVEASSGGLRSLEVLLATDRAILSRGWLQVVQ